MLRADGQATGAVHPVTGKQRRGPVILAPILCAGGWRWPKSTAPAASPNLAGELMGAAAQRFGLRAGHRDGHQVSDVIHQRGQREDMTARLLNLELRERKRHIHPGAEPTAGSTGAPCATHEGRSLERPLTLRTVKVTNVGRFRPLGP